MLFHEDFVRCPECNSPYFERNEKITIDKAIFEATGRPEQLNKKTEYLCKECGHVLGVMKD